jgi:hypothetical protein
MPVERIQPISIRLQNNSYKYHEVIIRHKSSLRNGYLLGLWLSAGHYFVARGVGQLTYHLRHPCDSRYTLLLDDAALGLSLVYSWSIPGLSPMRECPLLPCELPPPLRLFELC